jgi:hypothetical protein
MTMGYYICPWEALSNFAMTHGKEPMDHQPGPWVFMEPHGIYCSTYVMSHGSLHYAHGADEMHD